MMRFQIFQQICHDTFLWRNGCGRYNVNSRIWQRYSTTSTTNGKHNNIILMGSPGSGKTTVGKILASKLGCNNIDIDNNYLESHWKMTVAEKLDEVGGANFVKEEGEALLQFLAPQNSVISLTGSNPMYKPAMDYIKKCGTVVFLDIKDTDILERLERMKVDRIVGQTEGTEMKDILEYRQQFYEGSYDIRILCGENESPEKIAQQISSTMEVLKSEDAYVSTRQRMEEKYPEKYFSDVVLEGLAPDGGLYIPNKHIPHFTQEQWSRLINLPYSERALRILEQWIHPSQLHPSILSDMLESVYSIENFNCHRIFPLVHLCDNVYANELFYGPTASFKDAALQLLPRFFSHSLQQTAGISDKKYLFLVATSGDTGSAVLSGFHELAEKTDMCRVMVLYPEEGVSEVQKKQMKSVQGRGVKVVGVKSDFDFCQSAIKTIFSDPQVNKVINSYGYKFSAANSINWGRLLPQIVYHASGYLDLVQHGVISMGDPVDLCVPTGNFGNILAGFYAKQMGIPYRKLICASNVNNVLTEFFSTGTYDLTSRKLQVTAAPAIDILRSSNLERYIYHVSGQNSDLVRTLYNNLNKHQKFTVPDELRKTMQADIYGDWCTEEQCAQTIQKTFQQTGYLLDPHTAVAKAVLDRHNAGDCPVILASTAHYSKFSSDVLSAVQPDSKAQFSSMTPGELFSRLEGLKPKPVMHQALKTAISLPTVHKTVCKPNLDRIVKLVYDFVESSR